MTINETLIAAIVAIAADTTLTPTERIEIINSLTGATGIDELTEMIDVMLNGSHAYGASTRYALASILDAFIANTEG